MPVTLKESTACTQMAEVLYKFLPGSGTQRGRLTFESVAWEVGVGDLWPFGSKTTAIVGLLEQTLSTRRHSFEKLIMAIVRASIRYRHKQGDPLTRGEIDALNQALLGVSFKFPALWSEEFLRSLPIQGVKGEDPSPIPTDMGENSVPGQKAGELRRNLTDLQTRLYGLSALPNRQKAGLELEKLLSELFALFDLSPRGGFRVTGEQIDGSLELSNEYYLIEVKWDKTPVSEDALLVFRGKIEGKSAFTRGVFVSINGFSSGAIQAIARGKQPLFFLMDGYDISVVLQGSITLPDLLRAKLRHLAETGDVFLSAAQLIDR